MIELSRHIENLLLKHNCVIVPQLGGFVTQYVPARYIADEQIFLPPYRSVGFNPRLKHNDGLLIQSYMQTYDTSYPETIRLIEEAVAQVKEQLQTSGEFELNNIGKLILRIDGSYDFSPCEAGVVSPELYGFDSFSIQTVAKVSSSGKTLAAGETVQSNPKRNYTLSISRELVNYVAAAVCAVFFYFLWATPTADITNIRQNEACSIVQRLPEVSSNAPKAVQPVSRPVHVRKEQNLKTDNSKETDHAAAGSEERMLPDQEAYTIVLASSIARKGAETYIEQLHEKGYQQARISIERKMIRVIYNNYQTEAEAYKALNELRKDRNFAEAWVMKLTE